VRFRITRHSGSASPPDALDLLDEQLGASREGVRFSKAGGEITATWQEKDTPFPRTADELAERGRLAVWEVVATACERAPGLKPEWFAVSVKR
jgi:hypothetical protein